MERKARTCYKNNWHSYLLMSLLYVGAFIFYHTYMYYCRCGDMGIKINAATAQAQSRDAYFYTLSGGQKVVNGVTATPLLNLLHTPFINFNSCQVKQANFWINFVSLAGCCFFIAWFVGKRHWVRIYLLSGIIFFIILFARPFYYNLERGQVYVIYTMLFFALLFLLQKKQYFILGVVWAFAIALRPIFLTGTVLTLLYFNRKLITGLLCGVLLVVVITVFTGTAGYWKEYPAAMKHYAYEVPCAKGAGCVEWNWHAVADMDSAYSDCKQTLTPVETNAINKVLYAGTYFQGLEAWLVDAHKTITNTNFYSAILCTLALLLALGIRFRFKAIPVEKYALLIFLFYIISEICVPAARLRYSAVVWLFPIVIMMASANIFEIILLLPGLYFFYDYHHLNYTFGELWLLMPCLVYVLRKSETPYYINWFMALKQKISPAAGPAIGKAG